MVHGVDSIVVKVTQGDEFGIYRECCQAANNIQTFLLFVATKRDEAIRIGGQLADLLRARFRNELPKVEKKGDDAEEPESTPETPPAAGKPRRVSGIGPKIQFLIRDGAKDEQIEAELLDLYLAKGHTAESGLALLRPYIREIRKAK